MSYARALESAKKLREIMERWGVRCSIELQGGRGSDPWATPRKYHRMHHHTVSTYRPGGNLTPVLSLVKRGRPDVVGPLANGYGGFDLVYRIICMGLANHPGRGGPITIDGVHIPRDSARSPTWGTEWEGGLQDWEQIPGMLEFMGRADCALAEWTGRPLTSQMEHLTWAPTRKVDRRKFTRERGIALSRTWYEQRGDDDMSAEDVREIKAELAKVRSAAESASFLSGLLWGMLTPNGFMYVDPKTGRRVPKDTPGATPVLDIWRWTRESVLSTREDDDRHNALQELINDLVTLRSDPPDSTR